MQKPFHESVTDVDIISPIKFNVILLSIDHTLVDIKGKLPHKPIILLFNSLKTDAYNMFSIIILDIVDIDYIIILKN